MSSHQRNQRIPSTTTLGYARLEQQMVLLNWLHNRLGYANTAELLADIKKVNEGFTSDGPSSIYVHLSARSQQLRDVTTDDLRLYDINIATHLAAMNAGRAESITLRYFQYLAALYTEIYLDRYSRNSAALLSQLNNFVQHTVPMNATSQFQEDDLKKLAFWMATGSGKTLLFHLNYRQFLYYNSRHGQPIDNILLITPNEGLSQQHLDELEASYIPATRFDLNEVGGMLHESDIIKVTEITKLVEEKHGGGTRVPVEAFEGNNLIFVDEGHKGAGGDAWRAMRDALGETGFTFEYSATFGQALAAANNDALLAEYGKAIAFDYSYRHFYNDGYGKDFRILNVQREGTANDIDTLLLANLLSFYEQQLAFDDNDCALRPYNLERPLWTFIGGSVNAVYRKHGHSCSDILTIVCFLHRVLSKPEWAKTTIRQLMDGQSGLRNDTGQDLFANKFGYLHQKFDYLCQHDSSRMYRDLLEKVMHTQTNGGLRLYQLRSHNGELGLKVDGSDHYFGVIYIGDTRAFRKLIEGLTIGILIEDDIFSSSLFDRINEREDGVLPVQILIGAKKFMEGWNSWRVSNMGLLNIGRSEGSQIIQLFGRGVRLRGRNMSLQRSAVQDGPHPPNIQLLETLNIFALRADYMVRFRDYLENEGIDTEETVQIALPVQPNQEFLDQGLVIPRIPDNRHFQSDDEVLLRYEDGVGPVSLTMAMVVQELTSVNVGVAETAASSGNMVQIPAESLDLVDWDAAYTALLAHRDGKEYGNLVIQSDRLRSIIAAGSSAYNLIADEAVVNPRNLHDRERLQEAVVSILRQYAAVLYQRRQQQWESQHLVYKMLDMQDANFRFNASDGSQQSRYIIQVPRRNAELITEIERLIADYNTLYFHDQGNLPRIYFDRHLYQPLLVKDVGNDGVVAMSPPGLEESELKFVADLRNFWNNRRNELPGDMELFLHRNLSRGQGVGFFESEGFYPDFILWVKSRNKQRIVFVEPHGMLYAKSYGQDDKARLHERLKEMEQAIAERSSTAHVQLDSYIISATPYEELRLRYGNGNWDIMQFATLHILFQEQNDYVATILQCDTTTATTTIQRNNF